ncbi:uncharacterized protein LOC141622286 [Silene latifolia]|uniref:uncharacterized protein LOC141622286 n=1 Tax=Silene latifolia TaxID=37657 RepID=UPI003D76BFF7
MNWHHQIIKTTPAHLFLLSLLVLSFCATFNVGTTVVARRKNVTCIDQERDALLKFKHDIQSDECGLLDSWVTPNTPDCCTWKGVSCSNQSGHVTGLNLSGAPYQEGYCLYSQVISPSLGELKHLKYLDLSSNGFYGMDIPSCIGSLVNLVYLNLSESGFSGNIPHQLGNLTSLTSLDLSYNYRLSTKSLNWLSRLTLLRDINLLDTDLSKAQDWFSIIGSLPLLEVLKMDGCQLSMPPSSSSSSSSSSSILHSANLRVISLSGNNFSSSSIFQWLFNTSNYSSLEHLDLSFNYVQGPIPDAIWNLRKLTYLRLSQNSLSSTIPDAIGNLEFLTHLDLGGNSISNKIPDAIGNLKFLEYLDLSGNSLSSKIPDAIGNLKFLEHLDLSQNSLSSIPDAIGNLKFLEHLDLSQNSLSSTIPGAIGNLQVLIHLDLSNNSLSGPIPSFLGGESSLSYLNLSNNQLEGTIPTSMANLKYLEYLDLSSNNLSGDIPCIGSTEFLAYVNLSYNNLSGSMPKYYMSNFWFDPIEAFQGNPNLRTDEFNGSCEEAGSLSNEQVGGDDEHDKDKIYPGLYVSIGIGIYTGFWIFCGTLTLKNSWRHAYFRFLDHIIDKIYVTVVVYLARFRRNSQV